MPRCLESALTLDGTLGPKERAKRRLLLAIVSLSLVVIVPANLMSFHTLADRHVNQWSYVLFYLACLYSIGVVLLKRALTDRVVVVIAYLVAASLFLSDVSFRTVGYSQWPGLVLLVDFLLVLQAPPQYSVGLVVVTVVYLTILGCEEMFRFGLFDVPGLVPQDGPYGRRAIYREMADCANPPCRNITGGQRMMTSCGVFVIDFIATRGFARSVLKEQATMERTIETVQEVATLLAAYDVEGVSKVLTEQTGLPQQMHETLDQMEQNLRMYRPYLPDALFATDEASIPDPTVQPQPGPSGVATIVFTDIRSSTSIWELAPEGMRAAMRLHNAAIRRAVHAFNGYEVKTIGDAFMVAFADSSDGVGFALRVQEELLEVVWPEELLDVPMCAWQGPLWCGLAVRIGVNTGEVTVEENALTGRLDYFGHTVNVAARLEGVAPPGAVAVPSEVWGDCACVAVVEAVSLELKGISGRTKVCYVWPPALAGRRVSPLRECLVGRSGDSQSSQASGSSGRYLARVPVETQRRVDATIGVLQILVEVGSLQAMSAALSTLTVVLDQSGGGLVTLLGCSVCVGWNLVCATPTHIEQSIRFVQRLHISCPLAGAGLVTGTVIHGDVGARRQRFVTVMGPAVLRSWALCVSAVQAEEDPKGTAVFCLYEPPPGAVLPSALLPVLTRDTQRSDGTHTYRVSGECKEHVF